MPQNGKLTLQEIKANKKMLAKPMPIYSSKANAWF